MFNFLSSVESKRLMQIMPAQSRCMAPSSRLLPSAWRRKPASASVLFFTGQSAYNTALSSGGLSASSFDFNSTPAATYANATGLTIDGVNFVGANGNGGYI